MRSSSASSSFRVVGVVAALLTLALASGLAPRRDGPPFAIGTGIPRLAMNEAGQMAVAWRDNNGTIRLRVYDPEGAIVGESEVGSGSVPCVALDARGEAAVAWYRCSAQGDDCSALGRLFDAAGAPRGAEFPLDPVPGPTQRDAIVVRERSGRTLFGWTEYGSARDDGYVRLMSSDGAFLGEPVRIGPPDRESWAIWGAVDASGEYLIVEDYLWAQRYNRDLLPVGSRIPMSWPGMGIDLGAPRLARSPDGPFVVARRTYWFWEEYTVKVQVRRYDATGTPLGDMQEARWGTSYLDSEAAPVAIANRGEYAVVWSESPTWPPSGHDVWLRAYDAAGAPAADAGPVHEPNPGDDQRRPDIGSSARGDLAVVYYDAGRATGQRYCANLSVTAPVARTACVGGTASLAVQATGRLPLSYTWRKDGVPLLESARVRGTRGPILVLDPVAAEDAGTYDCVVSDACPVAATVTSAGAALTLGSGAPLGAVSNVRLVRGATTLTITWDDVPGATDYVVTEDVFADGGFVTTTGTAASGAAGLTVPLPRSERFYRVAARNAACGSGAP